MRRPFDALKSDASDLRMLGLLFATLGCFPLLAIGTHRGSLTLGDRLVVIIDTAVHVGPGVWYIIAARFIRRGNVAIANYTNWVVVGQLGVNPTGCRGETLIGPKVNADSG